MEKKRKPKTIVAVLLMLALFAGTLFSGRMEVFAAGKKAALNVTDISFSVGQSRKLSVSNAEEVTWSTSDKSVATVSKTGRIRAKKPGKATITAEVSGKKLTCNVVVSDPSEKEKNILIVYFSQTGTTRKVAQRIQKLAGGDLVRIRPKTAYTSNYDRLTEIARGEIDSNARPRVTTEIKNIASYDVIYVGYPIWWGTTPRVVNTFLEKYDLSGKTIIPFCTSGGSDISGSLSDLKGSCRGAEFKEGYTADSGSTAEIRRWLREIGELETGAAQPEPTKTPEPSAAPTAVPEPSAAPTPAIKETEGGKILVAYFSWSGTSERIAQNIIGQTGADSFRIERETPYSTDYTTVAYGDAKEEADHNERPPIKDPLPSLEQYDKIILCYPIWWHTAPMAVGTFLESYDLNGKEIYPVSQSASMDRGQYGQSVSFIRECAPGAVVDDGIFSKNNEAIQSYIAGTVMEK